MVVILGLEGVQEDAAKLVERLRSESPEERAEATRKLKKLGKEAVGDLKKAAGDKDLEVSGRAKHLLEILAVREKLTVRLLEAMPEVEDRLATDPHAWTEALLEAAEEDLDTGKRRYPTLRKKDFEPLAVTALRRARTPGEKEAVLKAMAQRGGRSAIPEIVKLLKEKAAKPDDEEAELAAARVRAAACEALGALGAKEAIPQILPLLQEDYRHVLDYAAGAVGKLGAKQAIPRLVELLGDEYGETVQWSSAWALGKLGAMGAAQELVGLLGHRQAIVRSIAASALGNLGAKDAVPNLAKLLKDESSHVRSSGASSLIRLDSQKGVPTLLEEAEADEYVSLFPLNRLRQPEVYRRIQGTEWVGTGGTVKEVLEELAKAAGMKLDPGSVPLGNDFFEELSEGPLLGIGVLQDLSLEKPWQVVLEPDRMRVLSRKDALDFWKAWWAGLQRKDPGDRQEK